MAKKTKPPGRKTAAGRAEATPVTRASLEGKTALITGGNRGLGLAFALALAARGCNIAITGRNEQQLSKAAKSLAPLGTSVLTHYCDVREEESVSELFRTVKEQFGHLDILINNAGVAHGSGTIQELSIKAWRETVDTNLTGTFLCTRAALPLMSRGGAIVNNLSVAARNIFPGMAAYNASKFGALGFTDALRLELQPRGIRVIALMPGATDTDIWKQFWPNAPREKMLRPETIADALIAALLLPESASVNEVVIAPTGGAL